MCPDGSTVGRDPNNDCRFFPCPSRKCYISRLALSPMCAVAAVLPCITPRLTPSPWDEFGLIHATLLFPVFEHVLDESRRRLP